MRIAIFGAGIAGLSAAAALHADGHDCRVYEPRAHNLDAGIGFLLMPQACQALQDLGLSLNAGQAIHRYLCRDEQGSVLQAHGLPPGLRCVRRRDVLQALLGALPTEVLVLGQGGLGEFEFDAQRRVRRAWLDMGCAIEADVYVAADGVRSRARTAMFPDWKVQPAPVFEVTGAIEEACWAQRCAQDFNKFHSKEGGLAYGVLAMEPKAAVWFMQFDARRQPPGLSSGGPQAVLEFVTACVGDWAAPVPDLIARTATSRVHFWRPLDMDPVPQFHRGNLVLLGDAAHPMSPFSSQGVSSALLDAISLAQALREAASLEQAFERYSTQRRQACLPLVQEGRAMAARFLQPGPGGVPLAIKD